MTAFAPAMSVARMMALAYPGMPLLPDEAAESVCESLEVEWSDRLEVKLAAPAFGECEQCRTPAVCRVEWQVWIETWAPRTHSIYALENGPYGDGDSYDVTEPLCAEHLPDFVAELLDTDNLNSRVTLVVSHA